MRYLKAIVILLLGCCSSAAREYEVFGPEGGIAFKISLPEGFNPKTDRCPMVILMHGIFSSKDFNPMPALAKGLAQAGIASIRFDFDGHGQSEGRKQDMTIEKELADARAIWEYVRALPYVDGIGLLGHSQGGVIASMTAGRLAAEGTPPDGLVLISPGSVIKEACQAGKFFNARFDPANPPEYIRCWGMYKLGREYLLTTQQLDIYGFASAYEGPVRVLHGTRDSIVPMWCSEKFVETYGDRSELVVVEGENHTITRKRKEVVASVAQFFTRTFSNRQIKQVLEELKGRDVVLFVADKDEISPADVPFPVVFTGMGKMRMFSGLVKWHETLPEGRHPVVLNIGSAGSAKYPIGTIVNCTRIFNGGCELVHDCIELPGEGASIFSGDYFMSTQTFSPEQVKELSQQYDLFDMEAYAVAQFCKMYDIPFYCLKAVSDNLDGNLKDWRSILADIRVRFTEILNN